ncbi:hypothetical protein TRICI_003696 [Trichomonascus ciferrii]|uniref:Uncharacterized protein n=1 Tax=Trichomonascus ciferrii TaxID=44093 RepID=A0A642V2J8_9ASCO|nr:hypothetical protein TRICI_003696 [Trichomonascus ciferrii]
MVSTKYLASTLSIIAVVAAVPVPQDDSEVGFPEDVEAPQEFAEPPPQEEEEDDIDESDEEIEKRCFMGLCKMFGKGKSLGGGGGGSINVSGGGSTSTTGSTGSSMNCGTSSSSSCSSSCTTTMSCAMLKIKRTIFARI